jgi:hypothetical protein
MPKRNHDSLREMARHLQNPLLMDRKSFKSPGTWEEWFMRYLNPFEPRHHWSFRLNLENDSLRLESISNLL